LEAQSAGGQEILKGVTPTVIAMIVAAMLLTIVVAYCLGTLKLAERRTEYATLRALGYGPKRLFGVINADTIPSLLLALAAGFPAGVTFLSVFVAAVSTDVRSYQPQIGLPALAAAGLMVIAAVLLVNLALLRAVMRTNLPEAVKARE
ncbi:MAG: ABC transporter permease, partial [Bifidobacteriaceae bacterium]|jgi:putative ABC transport system permease protein|nr:ABC transporter permease [Bifidobacteriaceae bacterium]